MLLVQCNGCGRVAFIDCPQAHPGGARTCTDPACGHLDPDFAFDAAQPACNAEGKCCRYGHTEPHRGADKNCDVAHDPCTDKACPVAHDPGVGHCGPAVDGCKVCRPLTITIPPGHGPTLTPTAG